MKQQFWQVAAATAAVAAWQQQPHRQGVETTIRWIEQAEENNVLDTKKHSLVSDDIMINLFAQALIPLTKVSDPDPVFMHESVSNFSGSRFQAKKSAEIALKVIYKKKT